MKLYNLHGLHFQECPRCRRQPELEASIEVPGAYYMRHCGIGNVEPLPMPALWRDWTNRVQRYIADHPEAYND